MAKKIKFALEMADGYKVRRGLEELREHFDIAKATEHFIEGKLVEWLEDRYYDGEAMKIRALDKNDSNFSQKLCEALGVAYEDSNDMDIDALERINEKRALLQQKTSDAEIIANADKTAFTQEDLAELLDEDLPTIYLCGEIFTIPARITDKKYIGILGTPKININVASSEELEEKRIEFFNVELPEELQYFDDEEDEEDYDDDENEILDSKPFDGKIWECSSCGWQYDEEKGDTEYDFAPYTHFEDLSLLGDYFACPVCGAAGKRFKEIEREEDTDDDTLSKKELWDILVKCANATAYEVFQQFDIYASGWSQNDKIWWEFRIRCMTPTGKMIDNMKRKLALKMICKKKYTEEDLVIIVIAEDVSGGIALTTDSLCLGGKCGNAIIPYENIKSVKAFVEEYRSLDEYGFDLEYLDDGKCMTKRFYYSNSFDKGDDAPYSGLDLVLLKRYLEAVINFYGVDE